MADAIPEVFKQAMPTKRSFPYLYPLTSPGAQVSQHDPDSPAWKLSIPAGIAGKYRCAQIDDYQNDHRRDFNWEVPIQLSLQARVSHPDINGTWGFGLWNDPFSASQGLGGMKRRLPTLPNCAWFFFASPPNYLALRDNHPAQGLLAATFRSPTLPTWLLAPGVPFLPLLAFKSGARILRRLAGLVIHESAQTVPGDPCQWRHYSIIWKSNDVILTVEGQIILRTPIAPLGKLGLVIWIDNQYMAFPPGGSLIFGTLPSAQPAWLEIQDLQID